VSLEQTVLPRGWAATTLGEIVQPTRPRHSPQDHPNLPFIGMENVEAHTMKLLGTVPASTMRSSAVHFFPGDVLYGRLRPYLNKVLCPDFEGLCSAEFIVFPGDENLHSKFIQYLLNSTDFVSFASRLNAGDRPRVDFEQISGYPVPLAPLLEQDQIVGEIEKQFTRLDAAVGALKRVQANLKRYRAAVLKAAVEGRLVPTEAELARREGRSYEPASELLKRILAKRRSRWEAVQLAKFRTSGEEPKDNKWKARYKEPQEHDSASLPTLAEGWTWATVEALALKVVDGVHKKPDYVEKGIPFVTVRNLTAGAGIDFENLNHVSEADHKRFIQRANPQSGDLLISKDGTLGIVRAVRTEEEFSIFVSVAMVKPVLQEMTDYLEIAFSSPQVQVQMVPKGSGLQHIHLEDLRADFIPLAPLPEQERMVAEVQRRLSIIDELQTQAEINVQRAGRLRQAVLKRAFEGKLVAQDSTDEPASVLLERIRAEREKQQPAKSTAKKNKTG
jgi:type I restriction enzyme S subunit